jgi:tagatose-1,6-bisphosphate aldolase non-catalytic subunit AgaZ/GatZ
LVVLKKIDMKNLNELIKKIINLRESGRTQITLLAVCPNSDAVLEAAVKVAAANNMPMLFAATLNQVDIDGGYTGWTQQQFVSQMRAYAQKYSWDGPLYPCLDHGGPWLKDRHTLERLPLNETMEAVKQSLTACLEAGYQLLHIDPTVDRELSSGQPLQIETVVARTVELISHAESERTRLGLPAVAYEVGTEEVHGGLVAFDRFKAFLSLLKESLHEHDLDHTWPCFIVAQVGTDLHTTDFDSQAARRIFELISPFGSLAKGHYTDWVDRPEVYPACGMGGANVGPEFTSEEYLALQDLEAREAVLVRHRPELCPSRFIETLTQAVVDSGRWQKWLQPDELGLDFFNLSPERQDWLAQTGARYIWTAPSVIAARRSLYDNLSLVMPDPHAFVVDRIARAIDKYVVAFNLFDSLTVFEA